MDRASSLAGAYAKLDRADEHFKALEAELQTFVQGNVDAARGKLQNVDGETFYVMEAHEIRPVPLPVGVILGDAIHNLRSALDHTLCQLVALHGGEADTGNQFPIFTYVPTKKWALDKWAKNIRGVTGPDLALIEHVQPHTRDDPTTHPLAVLQDVSNADKHRLVLDFYLAIDGDPSGIPEFDPHDLDITGEMRLTAGVRLKPGTEIFRVPVRTWGDDPHMEVHGSFPVTVAFGEAAYEGPGLNLIRKYVRELVQAFEDPKAIQATLDRIAHMDS